MANKGLVIHIEDADDQRVEIWTEARLQIGVTANSDVRLRDAAWENAGVMLRLERRADKRYYLAKLTAAPETPLTLRQAPLTEGTLIDDGGAVRVGDSPLAVRFLPFNSSDTSLTGQPKAAFVPFINDAALEAANAPVRSDAIFFVRELGRELWRELRPRTKALIIATPLILLLATTLAGLAIYLDRRRSLAKIAEQSRQLTAQEQRIAEMQQQLGQTDGRLGELDKAQKEAAHDFQDKLNWSARVWQDYHGGVALLAGVYQLVDTETGRPLRYPENESETEGETANAGAPPALTTQGRGPLAEYEFVGTGFYVGGGYFLTNRHVVQPWTAARDATLPGRPVIKSLKAYFPNQRNGLPVRVKQTSSDGDAAACIINAPAEVLSALPALPLTTETALPNIGTEVALMGYPYGTDRLLDVLSDSQANEIQKRYSSSLESLLKHLASKGLIKPLTTKGHITDSYQTRIVSDAITGEGGSGTPIFGPSGTVVGISFGIVPDNRAANMGLATSVLITLLNKAGWQPPKKNDE